jgi:hypothetical protein
MDHFEGKCLVGEAALKKMEEEKEKENGVNQENQNEN